MEAGHARAVEGDLLLEPGRVPDVHGVDHHADVVEPRLVEQRDRLADRRQERRLARLRGVRRLEPEPDSRGARGRSHLLQPVDHERARLGLGAIARRSRQAHDRGRLEAGQARHARAQRLDALGRIGRALQAGQRELQERGHRGHAIGGAEAARTQHAQTRLVLALGQLELPDADAVEARRGVGRDVLGERGARRRDLTQRDLHSWRRSRSLPAAAEPRSSTWRRSGGRSSCLATR